MNLYQASARCDACGSADILQNLCKGHAGLDGHTNPIIHRACRNCKNVWNELPLNAPVEFGLNKITDGDLKKGD